MAAPAYCTVDDVLARLRLDDLDPDAGFVAQCTEAANDLVDRWLDRHGDPLAIDPPDRYPPLVAPFPAIVATSAVSVAIRLYQAKDADTAQQSTGWDTGPPLPPRDPLGGVYDRLAPYRATWGWAPA
jgi:hypothetical protein